jgi:hypothetical protein
VKKKIIWLGLSVLIAAAMLLSSCGTSTTTPTTTTTTVAETTTVATTPVGPVVLTVTNGSTVKTYSLANLQALKSVTGKGGTKGKGGTVNGPYSYQGVALIDLLNAVGGIAAGQSVKTTASDGYTTTITYDQIVNGGFSTYDATGNPVTPATKPVLAVVYSKDGAALDSSTGPLEIGLLCTESLVSDGNVWAKMLIEIEIVSASATSTTTTATNATTTTSTPPVTTTTTSAVVTTTTTTVVPTTPVILTVVNGSKSTTFSLAQIQQLPAFFATTGTINMKNVVSGPDAYVGVELKDLLNLVGGFTSANSVTITSSDGFSKTLTYAMVQNGTGISVVDGTGAAVTPAVPPIAFLAYSKNGAALDSTTGPLYFGYCTSSGQYTIANTWVKMATTITIIAAQ